MPTPGVSNDLKECEKRVYRRTLNIRAVGEEQMTTGSIGMGKKRGQLHDVGNLYLIDMTVAR